MNNELRDVLNIANREFQEFIDQVSQNGTIVVEWGEALRRLVKVDLRLNHVSKLLAVNSKISPEPPEAASAVLKYRDNLKSLLDVMEAFYSSLLAEKSRLDNLKANMRAARKWAASVRDIS